MDFDEDPEYLNLDNILAQTQRINCKFLFSIPGLEFINHGYHENVTQTTELFLPFWMAKTLYTYSMIDIEVPKAYTPQFREILKANPDIIDLRRHGPHYYTFGKLLMELKREKSNNLPVYTDDGQRNIYRREEGETLQDRRSISESLIVTFHHRRHQLLVHSTANSDLIPNLRLFESRLDNLEKRLFRIGRQQVHEIIQWKSRKIELTSNNTLSYRISKRRKTESSKNKSKDKS